MRISEMIHMTSVILMFSGLGGCVTAEQPSPTARPADPVLDQAQPEQEATANVLVLELPSAEVDDPDRSIWAQTGTGEFLNDVPQRDEDRPVGDYDVFLENVSLGEATDAIIGEILGESYVIDGQLSGEITLKSNRSLDRKGVLDLFESALAALGAELSYDGTLYRILPAGAGADAPRQIRVGENSGTLSVVELEFAAAAEMARILEPVAGSGSVVRVDPARNVLILDGTDAELQAIKDLISIFDKDWMTGMSVSILQVDNADPSAIASELDVIFGAQTGGPAEGLVQFIPNERLSSVLAISAKPDLLDRAEEWVTVLSDTAGQGDNGIEIYEVQNRIAADLAEVLQALGSGGTNAQRPDSLAPGSEPVTVTDIGNGFEASNRVGNPNSNIVIDDDNNALILQGDTAYRKVLLTLARRLDVRPHQVLLEATIAEVTLGDELQFGVQWFFEEGDGQAILSDAINGAVTSQFPGFSFLLEGTDGTVVLNALSAITDVKIVSSPAIMVLNNQTATLQVGDEVPVTTQSAQSVIDQGAAIVNSITFRDTGILLTVTPRVNEEGRVLLEIQQEVSDVVATTSSGIDSPTIQQRRIDTTVVVDDNQSLLLGGLIQDNVSDVVTGVPILSSIPVIGNLFRSRGETIDRTELMILISPRVIRNSDEARSVTDEYRSRVVDAEALLEKLK